MKSRTRKKTKECFIVSSNPQATWLPSWDTGNPDPLTVIFEQPWRMENLLRPKHWRQVMVFLVLQMHTKIQKLQSSLNLTNFQQNSKLSLFINYFVKKKKSNKHQHKFSEKKLSRTNLWMIPFKQDLCVTKFTNNTTPGRIIYISITKSRFKISWQTRKMRMNHKLK